MCSCAEGAAILMVTIWPLKKIVVAGGRESFSSPKASISEDGVGL
jgi:hypothetical protein